MVRRKHTRYGADRFREDIGQSVARLEAFKAAELSRIERMQGAAITDVEAESLMLRAAFGHRIVSPRLLPGVISEWREPTHEAFADRTVWSLFNAFTLALADRAISSPQAHASATMRLQALLNPEPN